MAMIVRSAMVRSAMHAFLTTDSAIHENVLDPRNRGSGVMGLLSLATFAAPAAWLPALSYMQAGHWASRFTIPSGYGTVNPPRPQLRPQSGLNQA